MELEEIYQSLADIHEEYCNYGGDDLCGCSIALLLARLQVEIVSEDK